MLGLRESAQYGTVPGPSSLLSIFRISEMIYWMRSKLACFPWASLLLSIVRALTKIILPSGACESVNFCFLSMLSGTKRVQMQRSSSSVSPRKSLKNIDYLKNTNLNDTYHVKKYLKSVHDPSMPQLCLKVASHITLVDFADLFYSGTVRMLKHVLCLVSWEKGSFPLVVNHERALKNTTTRTCLSRWLSALSSVFRGISDRTYGKTNWTSSYSVGVASTTRLALNFCEVLSCGWEIICFGGN